MIMRKLGNVILPTILTALVVLASSPQAQGQVEAPKLAITPSTV